MRNRIRAAALITKGDKILLVQHVHPVTKKDWWVPPGGGIEDADNSIFDCAVRESYEECGLKVKAGDLWYYREYPDKERDTLNIEFFIKAEVVGGEITLNNLEPSEIIKQALWLTAEELQPLVVYPEILKNEFWRDLNNPLKIPRFLGRQIGS